MWPKKKKDEKQQSLPNGFGGYSGKKQELNNHEDIMTWIETEEGDMINFNVEIQENTARRNDVIVCVYPCLYCGKSVHMNQNHDGVILDDYCKHGEVNGFYAHDKCCREANRLNG